jgi:hypothetical protein
MMPGEETVFTFLMQNLGNDVDTFLVSYSQESGPTKGVTFTLLRSTFTVQPGETGSGEITIKLDEANVADLPVDQSVTFNLRVVSTTNGSIGAKVDGSVVIKQLHRVSIPIPAIEDFVVDPGTSESFLIEFTNEGNGKEFLDPELVVPEGWDSEVIDPNVILETGQTKSTQLWVMVPETASAGQYSVTVNAKIGDEVLASYNLSFRVDWVPDLEARLTQTGPVTDEFNMTQGKELGLDFTITNTGNREDTVTIEFGGLTRGLKATAQPQSVDIGIGNNAKVLVVLNASADAELLRGTYTITFVYGDGIARLPYKVNVTIMYSGGGGGPGPNDDDDDDTSGLGIIPLIAILVVVALAVVGALFMMARNRKQSSKMEDTFFVSRQESATSDVLQDEMTARRSPPPPPPEPPSDGGVAGERPAPIPEAPPAAVAAPSVGVSCPECGNTMNRLSPPETGMYCPMCGHKTDG